MENGTVGLFLNNKHWISREDGAFDDGDLEPHTTELAKDITRQSYNNTGVVTELHSNKTVITLGTPDGTEITIAHNYGKNLGQLLLIPQPIISNCTIIVIVLGIAGASIEISGNFGEDIQLCGLCGSSNGSLIKRDGSVADISSMSEIEAFAQSYLVTPRDQSLRPQRRECGK